MGVLGQGCAGAMFVVLSEVSRFWVFAPLLLVLQVMAATPDVFLSTASQGVSNALAHRPCKHARAQAYPSERGGKTQQHDKMPNPARRDSSR